MQVKYRYFTAIKLDQWDFNTYIKIYFLSNLNFSVFCNEKFHEFLGVRILVIVTLYLAFGHHIKKLTLKRETVLFLGQLGANIKSKCLFSQEAIFMTFKMIGLQMI